MSRDDVFNTLTKITDPVDPVGRFIQDDYPAMGLSAESSRNSFVIVYEKKKFQQAREMGVGWSDCLKQTAPDRIYINAYTGTIILPD
jgi:hypothetical protein